VLLHGTAPIEGKLLLGRSPAASPWSAGRLRACGISARSSPMNVERGYRLRRQLDAPSSAAALIALLASG
jgi:hypothetical protein